MKTKFQDFYDNSMTFLVVNDSISLTFSQFLIVFAYFRFHASGSEPGRTLFLHRTIFIMVLINTGTTDKLNNVPTEFYT